MPSFTKKAIIESFLQIAGKKSLEKITVRDIVDDCGINRNTFYYYFQDIYAVLEEICQNGIEKIPQGEPLPDTLAAAFGVLAGFTLRYPKVMRQIGISVGTEGAERYFGKGLEIIFAESLAVSAKDCPVPAELSAFVRHAFLGIFIGWVKEEKRPDVTEMTERLREIGRTVERGLISGKT